MKKNNKKGLLFILCLIGLFSLSLILHSYAVAVLIVIFSYIVHTLLFTDHIYYNPKSDYRFNFESPLYFEGQLRKNIFSLSAPLSENIDTCILCIKVRSRLSSFLFDPYIELTANGISSRQYFERGVNGLRFLNLSRLTENLQQPNHLVEISCKHCFVKDRELQLMGFENPDYCSKRLLIISPHADDAELAAFALYKNSASVLIATVSAGEVEAKYYETLTSKGNISGKENSSDKDRKKAAGLLKGRLRAWDSIAIPLWAGKHIESIHLGYFCMTLKSMFEQPDKTITSHSTGETDIRIFRTLNKQELPGDKNGNNSWPNLIADLTAIIYDFKPDIILTPHPIIDPQPDHLYSTRAIVAACEATNIAPQFLLYANHYHHTDMYPFGPEHSDLPLPPHFENNPVAEKLFSFPLCNEDEIDKICALQMMHDLNRPTPIKKRVRRFLQRIIGRTRMPYGDDEYLRKAIRQQELFWITSIEKLKKEFKAK